MDARNESHVRAPSRPLLDGRLTAVTTRPPDSHWFFLAAVALSLLAHAATLAVILPRKGALMEHSASGLATSTGADAVSVELVARPADTAPQAQSAATSWPTPTAAPAPSAAAPFHEALPPAERRAAGGPPSARAAPNPDAATGMGVAAKPPVLASAAAGQDTAPPWEEERGPAPGTATVSPTREANISAPARPAPLPPVRPKTPPAVKERLAVTAERPTRQDRRTSATPARAGAPVSGSAHVAALGPGAGPRGGTDGAGADARSDYRGRILARLQRYRHYPRAALLQNVSGAPQVRFVITARGDAADIHLVRSSGSPILDRAALGIVRRAAPFPPPPASLGVPFPVTVPVAFEIR